MSSLNFNKGILVLKKTSMFFVFISLLLQSCAVFYNPVLVENDKVLGIERVSLELSFINNNWRSQSYTQSLTFLKETDRENQTKYTLYDVIQLPGQSFDLEERMYMLINDEVAELQTTFTNQQKNRYTTEKTTELQVNDSTKQKVVTGYDVIDKKTIQMVHTLSAEQVEKMSNANSIHFQYYTGPSMLSTKLNYDELMRVKEWANK